MNQVEAQAKLKSLRREDIEQLIETSSPEELEILIATATILSWEQKSSLLSTFAIDAKRKLSTN